MSNLVLDFVPSRAISWRPGYVSDETGGLASGGWVWRYDLTEHSSGQTEVRLSYDWSEVGPEARSRQRFPPFAPDHLDNSLRHLAELVASSS